MSRRLWMLFALLVSGWGVVAWLLSNGFTAERAQRLIDREWDLASSTAASIDASLGVALARVRSVPKVLTRQSEIESSLMRQGVNVKANPLPLPEFRKELAADPDLVALGKRLESMISELGVDQIWVMNAAGDSIASGGFPSEGSATGVNYGDREYFRMAMSGKVGRQTAVGRTTSVLGVFYSAAVSEGDHFYGVVAVKVEVGRLAHMVTDKNALVTDENGVVIMAGDPRYIMRAIPGGRLESLSEEEKEQRYKRRTFSSLEMPVGTVERLPRLPEGRRDAVTHLEGRNGLMLRASSGSQADFLTVWVFRDISDLHRIRNDGVWNFILLFLAGASVLATMVVTLSHLRRGKAYQAEISRANVELRKLNEELNLRARFDSLTGCVNRRQFLDSLEGELKQSRRFGYPCALAVLDIDHFKSVNDQYGHAAGDAVLKNFADSVGHCLRSSDLFGRLGGEEFGLLMPDTSLAGALGLAERIRDVVAQAVAEVGTHRISCTVSIGVASWRGGGEAAEALMARADEAMYEAKRSGRNRVCSERAPEPV